MNIVENSQLKNNRHSTSVVENGSFVGQNVTLGCFVQVCRDARVGDNSLIEGLTIVSSNVTIGDRVKIGHGVSFVTPTTDAGRTEVADDVIIGAHAIIHHGVAIGSHAFIAPGAIVERTIPSLAIVDGSPARIIGYVGASQQVSPNEVITNSSIQPSLVAGVQIHNMPRIVDIRGNLTVGEFERTVPFAVKRYFMVFDVPSRETRGEHAHRECHQFLICVRGSCAVVADDGKNRQEFLLDRPDVGVHLPPMVWGIQYKYSADAVLLVFASHHYDSADYIRNYAEFRQLVVATA